VKVLFDHDVRVVEAGKSSARVLDDTFTCIAEARVTSIEGDSSWLKSGHGVSICSEAKSCTLVYKWTMSKM